MHVGTLGSIASNEMPPPLDLRPEAVAALADALRHDQAACAERYDRQAQAPWGDKSWQGLRLPIARKSSEPRALALDGGTVQALPQVVGPGPWADEPWRHQHWRLGEEPWGEAAGVGSVEGSDVPQQGAPSVGVARPGCGRLGTGDHGQAG